MLKGLVFAALLFGIVIDTQAQVFASVVSTTPRIVAQSLALFDSEATAQAHCPHDVVVWLNTRSGIYHYKGERWYGRTKHGAYVCEKEAMAAGDRATLNGQ